MLCRSEILKELNCSKELNAVIAKMNPSSLQEDLKQEVMMVACELQEERLLDYYSRNVLIFYLVRVILNMVHSSTSQFYKKYRCEFIELTKEIDIIDEVYSETKELVLDKIFGNSNAELHEKDMITAYAIGCNGNAKRLSKESGIPYKTVLRTLAAAKTKVKCRY